ncbi:hypothetical protein EJB05_00364, partial [Eragrostis curvula]
MPPLSVKSNLVAPSSPTLWVEVDSGMASFPLVGQPTGRLRSDLISSPHLHGFGCGFLLYRERVHLAIPTRSGEKRRRIIN